MTMTFETIQSNLLTMLKLADVKVGTKKAIELEHVYVLALRDVNIQIPAAVDMMLLSGRSVAGYKPSNIGKRVQLGYDHGEDAVDTKLKTYDFSLGVVD